MRTYFSQKFSFLSFNLFNFEDAKPSGGPPQPPGPSQQQPGVFNFNNFLSLRDQMGEIGGEDAPCAYNKDELEKDLMGDDDDDDD